jgi:hypothetical protein
MQDPTCEILARSKTFELRGTFFENGVKNLSDLKTFFQIFNCKLTDIIVQMIMLTIIVIKFSYSLRTISQIWNRQYPKNGGVRKAIIEML